MGTYSIKDLEKLSGIKAHTIRIWEQRYSIIEPERTETNIRVYSDGQLKKLLNIATLVEHGHKISKVAKLPHEEMNKVLNDIVMRFGIDSSHALYTPQINELAIAMIDLDEERFEKVFSNCILRLGFDKTIFSVIYPFLEKVGLMWGIDKVNPAQEHFVSNLIRQKIIVAIDALPPSNKHGEKYVLFLPENELHEIGLLLASYLLQLNGKQVVYLGQNVPLIDVQSIVDICNPDFLFCFFITSQQESQVSLYVESLLNLVKQKIVISGSSRLMNNIPADQRLRILTQPNDIEQLF